jgi:asparagine synthase (glutamine-hydrolysing)
MRLRFLAAAGPAAHIEALARSLAGTMAPALQAVLRAPELAVWVVEGTPHVAAPDDSAVAVGMLYEQADDRPVAQLPAPLPLPGEFLARYWGAYVLLARGRGTGHLVLRDPSGGVTAYHRRSGELDVYASDLALLSLAVTDPLEPDLEFLRQWLTFPSLRGPLTGVRDVTELAPGTLRRSSGGHAQLSLAWNPWTVARRARKIDDFEEAAALLRDTILRTVPRLAGTGEAVLHLSGGLDSSIVAAALAHGRRHFHAVTFATRGPDGDERIHARAVAGHLDCELVELVEEDAIPRIDYVPPPALRPQANALLQPLHRAFSNHCALTGADLTVDGSGGDNVFCHLGTASPALDALRQRGPLAGFAALEDLARLHGTTVWSVGRAALRRSRKPVAAWQREARFLAPGTAPPRRAGHPWLDSLRTASRGTVEHVHSIVGIQYFHSDPAPGEVAALHPLLAQPILETCLRIPSWLWLRGGRDRAVARAAFRGLLPEATLSRRSKGHLASLLTAGYIATRPQLERLLLDGRLAAAGLLDRDAIREYLRRGGRPDDADYMRLLDLSSAETWLRGFDP